MRRLAPLAAVGLLLTANAAAGADADCVAAVRDKPTLSHRALPSARFSMVTSEIGVENLLNGAPVKLYLRHGVETARLRHGVRLRLELGGCETWSHDYVFTISGDRTAVSDGRYWLRRASQLLAELAPASRGGAPLRDMSRTLAAAARSRTGAHLPYEEGPPSTGTTTVNVRRHGAYVELEVIHSITM